MTKKPTRRLNVRPDTPDFRDLPFCSNIALAEMHLAEARERWKLDNKPLDVCIYAHGGFDNDAATWKTNLQFINK